MRPPAYEWTSRDKRRYALALAPALLAAGLAALVLSSYSGWLLAAWIGSYLLINFFQAGCCVGCPYRGGYCPAVLGIYLSNWLSHRIYRDRAFDQTFFQRNAKAAEAALIVFVAFPIYWLWSRDWFLAPIYLLLLVAHFALFMPTQCQRCSYNDTCPGGQTWIGFKKLFRRG